MVKHGGHFLHFKKIIDLQRIVSLQIYCKLMKIYCKSILATNLQQNNYVTKNLDAILFPSSIDWRKVTNLQHKYFVFMLQQTSHMLLILLQNRNNQKTMNGLKLLQLLCNRLSTVSLQYYFNFYYNSVANLQQNCNNCDSLSIMSLQFYCTITTTL